MFGNLDVDGTIGAGAGRQLRIEQALHDEEDAGGHRWPAAVEWAAHLVGGSLEIKPDLVVLDGHRYPDSDRVVADPISLQVVFKFIAARRDAADGRPHASL